MKPLKIDKKIYLFALFLWILHLIWMILSFFADIPIFFVLFFLIVLAESFLLRGADKTTEAVCLKRAFDCVLCVLGIVSLVIAVISGCVILGYGNPAIIDGGYYAVNHGTIVETLNENKYYFLKLCEAILPSSVLFSIHTQRFYRLRRLFLKEG